MNAKKLNVKIAFENTQIRGYQEYVVSNIKDDNIGFCIDTGHNHTHFNDDLNLDLFKDRIFCLHLHDNHGNRVDQHLIPFDGYINWHYIIEKLKQNNYNGYITLETVYSPDYENITVGEFYKKCYEAASKLNDMLNEKNSSCDDEMFDIYTRDGKYLGEYSKSNCHTIDAGVYHKPVWIWIINDKSEILVQKRAKCKKNSPGLWDMPSAGHVVSGETSIAGAIRETFEELGIETKEEDYEFLFEYIYDRKFELAQVYLLKLNKEVSEFKLQESEVEEIKWLSFDEFKELLYSDNFCNFPIDYKDLMINKFKEKFDCK